MDVLADLAAEEERLARLLEALTDEQWHLESGAPRWRIVDVVVHLAQTEELVLATLLAGGADPWPRRQGSVDAAADAMVRAEAAAPAAVFERWTTARTRALEALAMADPQRSVAWVAAPLRPRTLATTRLAEHWAHALDVAAPLGAVLEDTSRLRHVAWLAHRTIPYARSLLGRGEVAVRCELDAPGGDRWAFSPEDAAVVLRGPAGDFCRVAARRMAPAQARIVATGPGADEVLAGLRTYAV